MRAGIVWGALAFALSLSPSALGNNIVTLTLTGAGSNQLGGVMIGPYTVNGGVSPYVICDDFETDSYIGQTWDANVVTFADLSGAKFYGQANSVAKYNQVAWLTLQMFSPTIKACPGGGTCNSKGDIQYAIWQIFDPSGNPMSRLSGSDLTNAQWWLNQSIGKTPDTSSILIYTPVDLARGPQEFFTVKMDESPAMVLLAFNLFAFLGLAFMFRRRLLGAKG